MSKLIQDFWQEMYDLLSKVGFYVVIVLMAIAGKVGWDITNKKRVSFVYILGFSMLAIFVSTMVYLFCQWKGYNQTLTGIMVGGSALFSRDIMVVTSTMKWSKVAELNWKDVILMLTSKEKK